MAREVRTFAEGSLRWVQSSGTGGWATASAAATALLGFVQAGLAFNSATTINTIMERGIPHHHKFQDRQPIEVTFTYLQGVTASMANPAIASGVSTPQAHFELRHTDAEVAAASAQYHNFQNGVLVTRGWSEAEAGNQWQETWRFLYMIGPTASGYLT